MTDNRQKAQQSQNAGLTATDGSAPFWERRPLWILAAVFAVLVAVNMCSTERSQERGMVPEEVMGTWTTTDPDYADRAFEIRRNSVVFHIGGSDYNVHLIQIVEVDDLDGPMLVTIHYADENGSNIFAFYYDPADGGVITFKNQRDMEWTRET
ncbi:MAG: hypothetical protein JSW71_13130 [Gemmatimonadota bacterium]|nr:MAG: hypothetical protein JSW71_13130 [Gemmatimonadota bacterium]